MPHRYCAGKDGGSTHPIMRRMFLALLILCLAVPAVAAPVHCAPAQPQEHGHRGEAMSGDHGDHQDRKPADSEPSGKKDRDCIGCGIPQLGASFAPEVAAFPTALAIARERLLELVHAARPETPPPRG